jgi:serine protease Do
VTQELAESFGLDKPYGALVSQVIKDSPAEKYGLKAGDVIVAFNDKPIMDSANLPPLVGQVPVGSTARLKILRNGQYKTVEVTIEVLPEDDAPAQAQKAPASSNAIGVEVSALTPAEQQQFGRGLRVSKVLAGSVAHKGGIKVGDIILELNRKDIKNVADFRKKVANLPTGSMIPVLVHRQGANKFLVLKIPEDD